MGGFRLHCSNDTKAEYHDILEFHYKVDDGWEGVLTYRAFIQLLKSGKLEFPSISEEEINDRSKGDIVFKGLAILQLLWFLTQMFVRVMLSLDVTNIELTTTALTLSTILMYAFWWSKPLDVHIPVILRLSDTVLHDSNNRLNHLDDQTRVNGQNESEGHGSRNGNGAVDANEPSSCTADPDSESDATDLEQEPQADSHAGDIGCAGTNESDLAERQTAPSQLPDQAGHSSKNLIDDLSTGITCKHTSAPEDDSHGLIDNRSPGYTGPVETTPDHTLTPLHGTTGKGRRITHVIKHILVIPWKAVHLLCLYTVVLPFAFSARTTFTKLPPQKWKHLYKIFYAADISLRWSSRAHTALPTVPPTVLPPFFFGILFGGIHYMGSTNPFPTSFEQKAWHFTIIIIFSPSVSLIWFFFLFYALVFLALAEKACFPGRQSSIVQRCMNMKWWRAVTSQWPRVTWWFSRLFVFPCVFIYITARLSILILSVISLRKLTETALQTVDWLELVPHV